MKQLTYQVRFTTPAFLGNAEQNGQWRTPPFKALLRQWWRVAYAADNEFQVNLAEMRREEGLLFGNAWLSHLEGNREIKDHCKSLVRIRLQLLEQQAGAAWGKGTQQGVFPLQTELSTSHAWFGLIKRGAGLPDRTGIKADPREGVRVLRLALPEQYLNRIESVMRLINTFGQVGSRSRGGWGSVQFDGVSPLTLQEMDQYSRSLKDCLHDDWPMSLARDNKGLCFWNGKSSYRSWDLAMGVLAKERRAVRSALKEIGSDSRSALGFAGKGRMNSPLRWKLRFNEDSKSYVIQAFAMPTKLPIESRVLLTYEKLEAAWKEVCKMLDQSTSFCPR